MRCAAPRAGRSFFRLVTLNGEDPEKFRHLPNFDELTSINPKKRIRLETVPERYTTRVMDLMTPDRQGPARSDRRPPRARARRPSSSTSVRAVIKNHP